MSYRVAGTEPQFLIDTEALNAKYAKRRDDPRRMFEGAFRMPKGASAQQLERVAREAIDRFIEAMRKKGWDLYSRVSVYKADMCRDIDNPSVVLLDKDEYRARAIFKMASTPVRVREEVPPGLVKRDPEHTITLGEALRARS
jgi:hypothetical protein